MLVTVDMHVQYMVFASLSSRLSLQCSSGAPFPEGVASASGAVTKNFGKSGKQLQQRQLDQSLVQRLVA